MRANGLQLPFHPFQIASWVVFGFDGIIYMVCALPLLSAGAKIGLVPCYVFSVIVLVCATTEATRSNPVDPHVPLGAETALAEENDSMPFCGICTVTVYPRSKHCRVCNKCVDVFDHHCMWINNCVGKANYKAFFTTISAVAVMIGIILGTVLFLLIAYIMDKAAFGQRVEETPLLRALPKEFFLALVLILAAINAPLFVLDVQLVALHMFLMSQELTTYEYIMNKRSGLQRREEGDDAALAEKYGGNGAGSGGESTKSQKPSKVIRTLPRCMDWIIFSRCGRRRRRKSDPKSKQVRDDAEQGFAAGTNSRVAPEKLGTADDGIATGVPNPAPAAVTSTQQVVPVKIGGPAIASPPAPVVSSSQRAQTARQPNSVDNATPNASPDGSPRERLGSRSEGGVAAETTGWPVAMKPPNPSSPPPPEAALQVSPPAPPMVEAPSFSDPAAMPRSEGSSSSSSIASVKEGPTTCKADDHIASVGSSHKVAEKPWLQSRPLLSSGEDGIWQAGGRYVAPEALDLREGPELTSTVVGKVCAGSAIAVWEVCRSTKPGSCGALCAFVVAQDGPEQGQQGWVRCLPQSAPEEGADSACPDAQCSPLRTSSPAPGGGSRFEPEAEAPPEFPTGALPAISAAGPLPPLPAGGPLPLDVRVEDRLVDDFGALQDRPKDLSCVSCTCAPPSRTPEDEVGLRSAGVRSLTVPATSDPLLAVKLPGSDLTPRARSESPSPASRCEQSPDHDASSPCLKMDGCGVDVDTVRRAPRFLPPLHRAS